MEHKGHAISRHGLDPKGIEGRTVYWNLPVAQLYEHAIRRGEATLAVDGPLVCKTGQYTGRSPNAKFTVKEPGSEKDIWGGMHNRPLSPEHFANLLGKARARAKDLDLYVFNGYAGADPKYRIRVRVINEYAWHNLFVRNMFVRETDPAVFEDFQPDFTVVDLPSVKADPSQAATASPTSIVLDFARVMVLIGGPENGGEEKKALFSGI